MPMAAMGYNSVDMGKVLYRKYRSMNLSEIYGQDHITATLENALKRGAISHAYLFTGPRGVGKTSIARILAHRINDFAYSGEDNHLDIIEIDAASNRGIDEIRDLREKVHISPASGKYKVYIIDEVHMLTTPAFNALLKVLEEPPAHVVFILATTESHKVPATIVSRTQRYAFRPIDAATITKHLQSVAKQEKLTADTAALELIATHSDGSFRDALSLLGQAAGSGQAITRDSVVSLLGLPPEESVNKLYAQLAGAASTVTVQILNELYNQGYQAAAIAKLLGERLRDDVVKGRQDIPHNQALKLLRDLLDVPVSTSPERLLEIILLDSSSQSVETAQIPATKNSVDTPLITNSSVSPVGTVEQPTQKKQTPAPKNSSKPAISVAQSDIERLWPDLLQRIKQQHNTLYGILRMAQPKIIDDNKLELGFKYPFHQKRMSEPKHRQIVRQTLVDLGGLDLDIVCVQAEGSGEPLPIGSRVTSEPPIVNPLPAVPELTTISNIFGGGELLKS